MKYDDASWHYGGKFPEDLPIEAGATHTGMFVAWALLTGLAGELIVNDFPEILEKLRNRSQTPGELFFSSCDGKFVDEDLNEQGNRFALDYFDFKTGNYLQDYEATLGSDVPTLYQVADTWENYDRLSPVRDRRFAEWKNR